MVVVDRRSALRARYILLSYYPGTVPRYPGIWSLTLDSVLTLDRLVQSAKGVMSKLIKCIFLFYNGSQSSHTTTPPIADRLTPCFETEAV